LNIKNEHSKKQSGRSFQEAGIESFGMLGRSDVIRKHYVSYVLKVLEALLSCSSLKTKDVNTEVVFSNPKPQLAHSG